ncbi:MAG: hypothetical protein Q8913_11545, partial [Bacteroidota bacterium]|nr:hypothetical protein [Bacteroidota bacterium]
FKAIYDSIGPFSLKKRDPSDTGDIGSHGFYLIFQNYVPNDSVIARLNDISGLRFHLVYHPALMSIPNDKGLLVGSTIDQILKTNPGDFVHRTFIVSVGNGISMPCAVRWRGKSLRAVIKQATRKS